MISPEQLASIIQGRAKDLCSPAGDRMVENKRPRGGMNYNDPNPDDYNDIGDDYWGMPGQNSGYRQQVAYEDYTNNVNINNSAMPDAIKQSMMENVIDTSALDVNGSVLDRLNIQTPQRRQPVREQTTPQQNFQQQSGIDYSIIKAIVKECLTEFATGGMLNESALKQIHLTGGKIKLVDNSGNIYASKLEKIGNVNDKKK